MIVRTPSTDDLKAEHDRAGIEYDGVTGVPEGEQWAPPGIDARLTELTEICDARGIDAATLTLYFDWEHCLGGTVEGDDRFHSPLTFSDNGRVAFYNVNQPQHFDTIADLLQADGAVPVPGDDPEIDYEWEIDRDELQARAEQARDAMHDDLDALFARVVTDNLGHDNWTGDVDPPTTHRFTEALTAVLRQLIENGLEAGPPSQDQPEQPARPRCADCGGPMAGPAGEQHSPQCRNVVAEAGDRVTLARNIERFPHFTAQAGMTGTVVEAGSEYHSVRMDDHLPGAEEWSNEIIWTDADEADGRGTFCEDVRVLSDGS